MTTIVYVDGFNKLAAEVDFCKRIRSGALKASQFPDTLTDAQGTFHKPAGW